MKRKPARYALASSLIAALLVMPACSAPETPEAPPATYVSPYDWSGLVNEDGRLSYYEGEELRSLTGVDVSVHQGVIDWASVASDGIEFAMIRIGNRGATEGIIYLDEQYEANIRGATEAGLDVGVYFFSQAVTVQEAEEEADFVLAMLGNTALAYPVVYDHEPVSGVAGRTDGLTRTQMTENARAFCERVSAAGYEPMIYGNKRDIARFDLTALDGVDVWFAEYGASYPSGQFDFTMWQYTNQGAVAGIDTSVDLNMRFLTETD